MARSPFMFLSIAFFNYIVLADITSPVNYQPIKYSHIHLEINYATNTEFVRNAFDFTNQNTLVTMINAKKPMYVSGRLLVVRSEFLSDTVQTGNISNQMTAIYDACAPISTFSDSPWIALVLSGGQCSIKDKLENTLRRSNASAVIILDNALARNPERYEFQNDIGLLLGELLIPKSILLNDSIFVNASIIVNNYFVDGFISRTSVLFVSISFILLMIISLVWLIFYYIQRFRYMHAKERLSRRLANAAKKALDKIPLKILSASDNEVSNDYDQCAICIDSYNAGETIRILPCKHIFHKVCIDSWLIEQRSCPMCKVDILKACGVLNVSATGKSRDRVVSSLLNQGLWVRNATVTATAALLEAGLTGDSIAIDNVDSNQNSRCRIGHSNFLQRYRERYGLYHCHRGHRRSHFHQRSQYFQEHHCLNNATKVTENNVTETDYNSKELDHERTDLISESEPSIISQQDTSIRLSIPEDKDPKYSPQQIGKEQELHEISNGLVYDICECSSDNTNGDCDVCGDHNPMIFTQGSITCSCETCSDCLFSDTDCGHYDHRRNIHNSGVNNLWKCCITSDGNPSTPQSTSVIGLYCCRPCMEYRASVCSSCNNKVPPVYKKCSSKSGHKACKRSNCQFLSLVKSSQYSQSNPTPISLRPINQHQSIGGQCDPSQFETVKRLKSMMLMKAINKNGTMDSYNKSSISDDYDYEADNGSSSMELSVPAVKLTVLPPQVQCHQGPVSSDCSNPSEGQRSIDDNMAAIGGRSVTGSDDIAEM